MSVQIQTRLSAGEHVSLDVEVQGSTLTVNSGTFKIGDRRFVLMEDFTYSASVPEKERTVFLHLAKKRRSPEVVVVVDEIEQGDYPIDFSCTEYEHLRSYVMIQMLPGSNALKDC